MHWAPLRSHESYVKEWGKELGWKMAKRQTFSSNLTFKRKKCHWHSEMKSCWFCYIPKENLQGKGTHKRKENRGVWKKKLKHRDTISVTSHVLSRCLDGSGKALLCDSLPAPTHHIFVYL